VPSRCLTTVRSRCCRGSAHWSDREEEAGESLASCVLFSGGGRQVSASAGCAQVARKRAENGFDALEGEGAGPGGCTNGGDERLGAGRDGPSGLPRFLGAKVVGDSARVRVGGAGRDFENGDSSAASGERGARGGRRRVDTDLI